MPDVKLTKNELRLQQRKLSQLQKYLPTLQLKKAMLQAEVAEARLFVEEAREKLSAAAENVESFAALLSDRISLNALEVAKVEKVERSYDNIAGVEVPSLKSVTFFPVDYGLFDTPPWVDGAVRALQNLVKSKLFLQVAQEKQSALEAELKEVAIRVNLFEKVLIPRALSFIKAIRIFLGDQELSAVARAKVAKGKIEARRKIKTESMT